MLDLVKWIRSEGGVSPVYINIDRFKRIATGAFVVVAEIEILSRKSVSYIYFNSCLY